MKILILEWGGGSYTYRDVVDSFSNNGIDYFTVSYSFANKNEDDYFLYRFGRFLDEANYDAVYSTSYFPLASKCCHDRHIKYISWCYDNPLDVQNIEETLGYPENHLFLFDRIQTEKYRNQGFRNVFHMPLAINPRRLDNIKLTSHDLKKYSSEISFVGKLYNSDLELYMSAMNRDMKEAIGEVVDIQMKLHGKYIIDEFLSDEIMDGINSYFKELNPKTSFYLPREALAYAMAAESTRRERLIILKLLSDRFNLNIYSDENHDLLKKAHFCGTCNYFTEMNKIFKSSKINLNINLKISQSGIPLRGMDVFGSGGFLLSTYQPEMDEYFVNGDGVVLFDTIEDVYYKTQYYLSHEDERQRIALRGREIAVNNFTYDKQFEKIFRIAGLS